MSKNSLYSEECKTDLGVLREGDTELSYSSHNKYTEPNAGQIEYSLCYNKSHTEKQVTCRQEWNNEQRQRHGQYPKIYTWT